MITKAKILLNKLDSLKILESKDFDFMSDVELVVESENLKKEILESLKEELDKERKKEDFDLRDLVFDFDSIAIKWNLELDDREFGINNITTTCPVQEVLVAGLISFSGDANDFEQRFYMKKKIEIITEMSGENNSLIRGQIIPQRLEIIKDKFILNF